MCRVIAEHVKRFFYISPAIPVGFLCKKNEARWYHGCKDSSLFITYVVVD